MGIPAHVAVQVWVAAWRHIVNVFRQQGADDVTWLWTVNIIAERNGVPSPTAWWPGSSYVTWVGIDGYYFRRSWIFASLFGPTIKAVRGLTIAPVLISETGVAPCCGPASEDREPVCWHSRLWAAGVAWFDAPGTQDACALPGRPRSLSSAGVPEPTKVAAS